MRQLRLCLAGGLLLYSVALLVLEWRTSQEDVRPYFTDIEGPVRFFAVNTTLSAFLLWSTALTFGLAALFADVRRDFRELAFCVSQVAVFLVAGADERFKLHEAAGLRLGVEDAYLLVAMVLAEAVFVLVVGRFLARSIEFKATWVVAGAFFAVMTVIDSQAPLDARLRLSAEDLAKTWAGFFLFLGGVQLLHERIRVLERRVGAV